MRKLMIFSIFIFLMLSCCGASPDGFNGTYTESNEVVYQTSNISNLSGSFDPSNVNYIEAYVSPRYNESFPYSIPTNGLIAYWKFDETTGIYVNDSSGNNINGTIQNGMNWTTDGKYNNAGEFDNVNDQVTFSSDLLKINNTMTYCCFVRPYGCTQGRLLYDPDGTVQNRNYMYWISTSYHPGIQVANGTSTSTVTSTLTVAQGEWNFVAFTVNNTNMKVYVDENTELLTLPYNITSMSNNTARIIGGTSTSSVLNATMDNVIVYNRTLNDSEIMQIYYDGIEDLQLKTNSHVSYTSQIDSSGEVNIPYDPADSNITSIQAYVPNNVTIGGVAVRYYSGTITPFTLASELGYTENTTLIGEASNTVNNYNLSVRFVPANNYSSGYVNYTTIDADILSADAYNIEDDEDVTFNQSSGLFSVITGSLIANQTYYYNISVDWANTPSANFSVNLASGDAKLTTQFTDTSDNVPTSWMWNFGDGETSVIQNPIHIYETAGNYTVSLTTTNLAGNNIETKTNYITVIEPDATMMQVSQSAINQFETIDESVEGLSISVDGMNIYGSVTDAITSGYTLAALMVLALGGIGVLKYLGYV